MSAWTTSRVRQRVFAVCAFGFVCMGSAQSFAREGVDSGLIARRIEQSLKTDRVPGAAVAVLVGGEPIVLRGYGHDSEGRPITPHTGFRLGSMSKAFTALAVMRSVEKGKLSVDSRVQDLLPDFQLADPDAAKLITLRQLLAHTSGFPPTAPRAARQASLAEHVAALEAVTLSSIPGERHVYSSPNYQVAARMLEAAESRPFSEMLRNSVLAPLGMVDAMAALDGDDDANFASGYRYWFGFPFVADLAGEPGRLATASLVASAADMVRFLLFQLGDGYFEGVRLLAPSSMAEMHRGTADGDGFRYAMGWRESWIRGTRMLHHGGILPDFRGKMILLPDLDAAVIVLTNVSSLVPLPVQPTSHQLADDIAEYLAGGDLKPPFISYGHVVLLMWLGLAALAASQLRKLWALSVAKPLRKVTLASAILNLSIGAALVAGPPILAGLSWSDLWIGSPDLFLWSCGMALMATLHALVALKSRWWST